MSGLIDRLHALFPSAVVITWEAAAAALLGYLVGSINPASLIARARGTDLRSVGSGNPGATNAARAMGWRVGAVVLLLDLLKGAVPVLLVGLVAPAPFAALAGLMAVVGHISSPFLLGHGGKGVATGMGALLAVHAVWALPVLIVFGLVVAVTRNVGLASVCGAVVLIPTAAAIWYGWYDFVFAVLLALLISVRHVRNLGSIWGSLRRHEGIPHS